MPRILPFIGITRILPFSYTRSVSFSVLARILLNPGSPPDSAIYRSSREFYPFSDTRSVSFFILAQILPDPGSPMDSTIYEDSRGFYPFPIPDRSVFRYSPGFYLISVIPWMLPFIGIHADSNLFQISPGHFFGPRMDST